MKVFEYTFEGHYLGAVLIVAARNVEQANAMAVDIARGAGLKLFLDRDKPVEVDLSEPGVIYFDNGDY